MLSVDTGAGQTTVRGTTSSAVFGSEWAVGRDASNPDTLIALPVAAVAELGGRDSYHVDVTALRAAYGQDADRLLMARQLAAAVLCALCGNVAVASASLAEDPSEGLGGLGFVGTGLRDPRAHAISLLGFVAGGFSHGTRMEREREARDQVVRRIYQSRHVLWAPQPAAPSLDAQEVQRREFALLPYLNAATFLVPALCEIDPPSTFVFGSATPMAGWSGEVYSADELSRYAGAYLDAYPQLFEAFADELHLHGEAGPRRIADLAEQLRETTPVHVPLLHGQDLVDETLDWLDSMDRDTLLR